MALPSLAHMLSEIPDPRQSRGLRHPLGAIVLQTCLAVLAGCRGPNAIAQWGRLHPELAKTLGYLRSQTPCAATFSRVFRVLDWTALEEVFCQWGEHWQKENPPANALVAIALDGKTLRGSAKRGAKNAHLVAAMLHEVGFTLRQQAIATKESEIPAAKALLPQVDLKERLVTMDALLTQRKIAQEVLRREGNYLMPLKENHRAFHREVCRLFEQRHRLHATFTQAETLEKNRGRVEHRRITVCADIEGYFDWPGLRQIYRLERTVRDPRTGQERRNEEVGLTSLGPDQADAARLLNLRRHHWHIENRLHWIRDVTYDEDRSQVRSGNAPQVLATVRSFVIAFLRSHGEVNIAAANRMLAAHPQRILVLLGVARK